MMRCLLKRIDFDHENYTALVLKNDGVKFKSTSINVAMAKTVLFLGNSDIVLYNFRAEIVAKFLEEGHDVHISAPYGERIDALIALGAVYHNIEMNRHGVNPVVELRLLSVYEKMIKKIQPDIVFSFTIKPNIYGGIISRRIGIPFVANVTGLGVALKNGGIRQIVSEHLYRIGLKSAQKVFFQNEANKDYMLSRKIVTSPWDLLPGSGVNLEVYCCEDFPDIHKPMVFTMIGRIMKDKGIDEFLKAAKIIRKEFPFVHFRVIGFFDDDYESVIQCAVQNGIIEYIEQQRDVRPFIKESNVIVQPSHHEGMSNVLLEAAATCRPVIASNIPGCEETFDEGLTGIGFEVGDEEDLARAMREFISLPYEKKVAMGRAGRRKMEREFDREIVVAKYIQELARIGG